MLKLDFKLETNLERKDLVAAFFIQNPDYKPTHNELETISNYILYGKDPDGTSIVERKEIEIKTKYSSYNKKTPESLDALTEAPGFNENIIHTKPSPYRKIKPSIDREKDADIPGIAQLWTTIDHFQHIIDSNTGKIDDPTAPILTPEQLYKYKHMVIDIRRQQFYLKDSVKPTLFLYGNQSQHVEPHKEEEQVNWDEYTFYPLGLYCGDRTRFTHPEDYSKKVSEYDIETYHAKPALSIDFLNPEHIYLLIEAYQDLAIQGENRPEETSNFILDTLNFYIGITELNEVKQRILKGKINQEPNEVIRLDLIKQFGVIHSANYISTIYKKGICVDIAERVKLHFDYFLNRDNGENWKVCSQCGRRKLRDTREFMRKSRSSDGLSGKCKCCEKDNRLKKKGE